MTDYFVIKRWNPFVKVWEYLCIEKKKTIFSISSIGIKRWKTRRGAERYAIKYIGAIVEQTYTS